MHSELLNEVICSHLAVPATPGYIAHAPHLIEKPEPESLLVALILVHFILHFIFWPCNLYSNPEGTD